MSDSPVKPRTIIAFIDEAEMVCRMIEAAAMHYPRPIGVSARGALAALEEQNNEYVPMFRRAAKAAIKYLEECIDAGQMEQ